MHWSENDAVLFFSGVFKDSKYVASPKYGLATLTKVMTIVMCLI